MTAEERRRQETEVLRPPLLLACKCKLPATTVDRPLGLKHVIIAAFAAICPAAGGTVGFTKRRTNIREY